MFTTRRSILASVAGVALAGFAALGAAAPANAATVHGAIRVGICKATGSVKHPYVFVSVKTDKLVAGHFRADDIVPAFTYTTADGITQLFTGQHTSGTVLTAACLPVVAVPTFLG